MLVKVLNKTYLGIKVCNFIFMVIIVFAIFMFKVLRIEYDLVCELETKGVEISAEIINWEFVHGTRKRERKDIYYYLQYKYAVEGDVYYAYEYFPWMPKGYNGTNVGNKEYWLNSKNDPNIIILYHPIRKDVNRIKDIYPLFYYQAYYLFNCLILMFLCIACFKWFKFHKNNYNKL